MQIIYISTEIGAKVPTDVHKWSINHLVKFQYFSDSIYRKNCDFVFLTPFSVHFWTFWTSTLKAQFQSALLILYLKFNHLVKFRCFSALVYWKSVSSCFDPIFGPFFLDSKSTVMCDDLNAGDQNSIKYPILPRISDIYLPNYPKCTTFYSSLANCDPKHGSSPTLVAKFQPLFQYFLVAHGSIEVLLSTPHPHPPPPPGIAFICMLG